MIAGGLVSAVLAGVCELIAVGFSRWWYPWLPKMVNFALNQEAEFGG